MQTQQFESRKADHLRLALNPEMEASGGSGFSRIHLIHEALPNLNLSEISLETKFWGEKAMPLFISSMTAGHHKGEAINLTLAKVAAKKRWPMGVGSQRRELSDSEAKTEWKRLRSLAPDAILMGNLGLAQLIQTPVKKVAELVNSLDAVALFVHANALQEAIQPEGTPDFKGGLKALEKLAKASKVPIILKETGCGFSKETLKKLKGIGLAAVDVSGFGGTHWGRIEGGRAQDSSPQAIAAKTFENWGESTVDSLIAAQGVSLEIWASGGIRSGLDAAKAIALGARRVGFAKPALEAALQGEEALEKWMSQMEFELKIALFCTGSKDPDDLRKGKRWRKI